MNCFVNAKEIVNHTRNTLKTIKQSYMESLHDKTIKTPLLIEIKNFMENLRSSLDYSAYGLFDKFGDKTQEVNIYFPYAWEGCSLQEFQSKRIIEKKIPGLSATRPDIVQKIESYQHFSHSDNNWLPKFMDLNNENKHQHLAPQVRKEIKQLNISSGGVSISLGEGSSMQMGSGSMIHMGDATIPGEQNINVNNPAKIIGNAKQEIITWVSFNFQSNNEPVLPLLTTSLNGIDRIVNELSIL